jgi:hypothetical protein
MPCNVEIQGGLPERNQHVKATLSRHYDPLPDAYQIEIVYEPARGYRVLSATRIGTSGQAYAPGDRFNIESQVEDVSEDVKTLLRETGVALSG